MRGGPQTIAASTSSSALPSARTAGIPMERDLTTAAYRQRCECMLPRARSVSKSMADKLRNTRSMRDNRSVLQSRM